MPSYQPTSKGYEIVPYDSEWSVRFEEVRRLVVEIFGAHALRIEHVGSTAVPDMAAKSLIDALVVVRELAGFEKERVAMAAAGYRCETDYIAERSLFFERYEGGVRTVIIHLMPEGHPEVRKLLSMRDYLRAHPARATEYSELKQHLHVVHPDDYVAYREGKWQFLQDLKRDAEAWYDTRSSMSAT